MGRRLKLTTEELSKAVNSVKKEFPGVFKLEDLRKAFKEANIPLYGEYATMLTKQGIIIPAGLTFMDGYIWKNTEPIHMNRIAELFEMTRKKVSTQCKKCKDRKKAKEAGIEESKNSVKTEESISEEHKELIPIDKAINKAIKLLLEHGYKITRPVITYEEVTIKNL